MAPNYLSEKYKVRKEVDSILYEVTLHVMPFHKEYPGLSIYFDHNNEVISQVQCNPRNFNIVFNQW